ncbi:MAG: hypothetical protein LPJ94_09995 [Thauera sp.]|nr:hypothetical protein [Thauera sp.]
MKPPAFHPVHIPLGLTLWSVWFVALYGGTAMACARFAPPPGAGPGAINVGFLLFTLLTALLPAYYAVRCWRAARRSAERPPQERFAARVGAAMHVVAVVAIVFVGLPLLGLPPCL